MSTTVLNPNPARSHVVTASAGRLISWQEVATIIDACDSKGVPIPFAVVFCTADEEAGTGGEIISYEKAVKYVVGGRVKTGNDPVDTAERLRTLSPKTRWLRRITAVNNMEVRNVHLHLILSINGKRVR